MLAKRTRKATLKRCPPADAAIWDCHILEYGDVLAGWRIEKFLACGGFGAVYLAVDRRNSRRRAAVKIFSGDLENDRDHGKERIEIESKILSRLDDRVSPKFFTSGVHKGRPFVVREFLRAIDPDDCGLPSDSKNIQKFLLDTIESLRALHRLGWVHCDIKPSNIAQRVNDGRFVLIDFGSAHVIEDEDEHVPRWNTMNTRNGEYVRVETRGYAPPELCFQPCRDIYALGHVIRDCFKRDVPIEWSLIINRCIANIREYRYPNLDSLEHDIRNIDRIGRDEMRRSIYEDRLRFMDMQVAMASERPIPFLWKDLKTRMNESQSADDAIYGGAGQLFLDFSALYPSRSIRITHPVTLTGERYVVVKGPGIVRVELDALLVDEEGDLVKPGRKGESALVFLWDNVTLINTTRKKLEDANVFYVVGDSCYLNFPNISQREIFNWHYVVTSNFGFSYALYHGPKDMASLIKKMNKRLERGNPGYCMVSAREFFSDGKDISIREYLAKNGIMREVLGIPIV